MERLNLTFRLCLFTVEKPGSVLDPDPDPDPYWSPASRSGSGSGSVKIEYGSTTLVTGRVPGVFWHVVAHYFCGEGQLAGVNR